MNFFNSSTHGVSEELYEELERLERAARRSHRQAGEQPYPYESWFEVEVALELLRRKFRIRPQYEVAGYRIDLVIEGLEARLAVECDGEAWHGPERYEHDMTRQRQLERAGWRFVRIRESEFYANRERAIKEVLAACDELGISPTDYSASSCGHMARVGLEEPVIAGDSAGTSEPESSGQESTEEEVASVEHGPFTGYTESCGFPDPREASPANVRSALRQIIGKDGPLTRASVFRLYVEGCPGLQRVGRSVRLSLSGVNYFFQSTTTILPDDINPLMAF